MGGNHGQGNGNGQELRIPAASGRVEILQGEGLDKIEELLDFMGAGATQVKGMEVRGL